MNEHFSTLTKEFRKLLAAEEVDLAGAALAVARLEYPDLNPRRTILHLDALAAATRERVQSGGRVEEQVAALNQYLFAEQHFRGNDSAYYDPRNSCLNTVLERKTGIPITLSLVYMEIGRRLGLAVDGITFPGHFLVRVKCDPGLIVLDPFNGGQTLAEADVRLRLIDVHGRDYAESVDLGEVLASASPRQILVRLIGNLKKIYTESGETDKAIGAISLLLIVDPTAAGALRDRGLLYREIEAYRAALGDLARYLELAPDAEDAEVVRHLVVELRAINARFN